jgi:hypothetical protein
MSQAVLEKFEELFKNPARFSPENMESLINETLKFFGELRKRLESPDAKVREEALNEASALKAKLEEQALALCKQAGLDPQAMEAYVKNPINFSSEEWDAMEKAKTDIASYQQELGIAAPAVKPEKKKAKKIIRERLLS